MTVTEDGSSQKGSKQMGLDQEQAYFKSETCFSKKCRKRLVDCTISTLV